MSTPRPSASAPLIGVFLATALALTACSADAAPPTAQTLASASAASPEPTSTVTSRRALTERDSPLYKLVGSAAASADLTQEELEQANERMTAYEVGLAACMKEKASTTTPCRGPRR